MPTGYIEVTGALGFWWTPRPLIFGQLRGLDVPAEYLACNHLQYSMPKYLHGAWVSFPHYATIRSFLSGCEARSRYQCQDILLSRRSESISSCLFTCTYGRCVLRTQYTARSTPHPTSRRSSHQLVGNVSLHACQRMADPFEPCSLVRLGLA